jgi:Icc-related predicted phosphoesterase
MKILAVSDLLEEFTFVDRLPEVIRGAGIEAVVFTGNILRADQREAEWRRALAEGRAPRADLPEVARERDNDAQSLNRFFGALSSLGVPVCVVPGRTDAPERLFLQAACNAEIVAARIYNVHRSFASLGSNWIAAGFGGEITEEERDHEFFLRYPGWEAQFSLEFLRHLDQDRILLFHTPPADELEGRPTGGHQIVSHILKTYSPRIAFCAPPGHRRGKLMLGNTLVVFPGRLADGDYAVVDTKERTVAFGDLR